MEKQIAQEVIEDCYNKILGGDFSEDVVKTLIDLENEQIEKKGHIEKWHLPGEEPEREITYDENLRSSEKLVAIVKYRIGTKAKIITGYLVEKKGNLRFEGFKFSVRDIIMWKLVHKPQTNLCRIGYVTETKAQPTGQS